MASSRWLWLVMCLWLATVSASGHRGEKGYEHKPRLTKSLVITWETAAPNGAARKIIKVNGQFPAPELVFDEDDNVEVTVYNQMPFNTTIHWHGLGMQGTPWSDGVPGLSQKPIEPGESFVYRFKASPPGTYWYHSHTRATLLDGLYGAIFIRRKNGSQAPWSLISNSSTDTAAMSRAAADPKLIVFSDWSNLTSWEYMAGEELSNLDIFCRDSVLIQGRGSVFCPGLEWTNKETDPNFIQALGGNVTDKGCLPFTYNTEGPYLAGGKPQLIPPGMQEGCVASSGSVAVVEVNANDKWVSLNFVMAATFMLITASIDQHDMWIYEIDGHYVVPRRAQGVVMYPGERYSVLVKLDKPRGDYILRAPVTLSQTVAGFGLFRYRNTRNHTGLLPGVIPPEPPGIAAVTYGALPTSPEVVILDGAYDSVPPFPPIAPAPTADETFIVKMGRWQAPWRWTFTGKAVMPVDDGSNAPLLFNPNSALAMDTNLTIRTTNGSWVDIVILVGQLPNEPAEISHAIHKHASKVWLVGQAQGVWQWGSVAEAAAAQPQSFNFLTPNYRDTIATTFRGPAWFVIRYQSANPGAWLLHCHVESHLAGGMGMVIMDGADKWPTIPPEYALGKNGYGNSH